MDEVIEFVRYLGAQYSKSFTSEMRKVIALFDNFRKIADKETEENKLLRPMIR